MKWISWVPLKVKIFVWRLEMDRIPTRAALRRRHINLQDVSCALCEAEEETTLHLYTGCGFTFGVWSAIGAWCKIDPIFAFDVKDLLKLANGRRIKEEKKIIQGIVMVSMWVIWNARNEKIFRNKGTKVRELVASIKSLSFIWLRSRSRFKKIVWKDWMVNPLYML
ncbi:putative reverse transcriptase zinc-binding domain-containing protein [Helianthus annuus]|nr:putative reverse transcriptase zinc-binding domain-containing protein [Helianthus annuus]